MQQEIKIMSPQVPLPTAKVGAPPKWPFGKLGVGEWFEAPSEKYFSLHACARHHNTRGKTFKVRKHGATVSVQRIA